jgi:curved DNA-binding protein CbpA
MNRKLTHYEVLEVSEQASPELIDAAWKVLMRRFHPDGSEPNAEKAVRINVAHDVLSNAESRSQYDAQLQASRVKMRPQPVNQSAYPAAYPTAYPGGGLDISALAETFVSNFNSHLQDGLRNASEAVLDRLAKDNPVIAELMRVKKRRRAG